MSHFITNKFNFGSYNNYIVKICKYEHDDLFVYNEESYKRFYFYITKLHERCKQMTIRFLCSDVNIHNCGNFHRFALLNPNLIMGVSTNVIYIDYHLTRTNKACWCDNLIITFFGPCLSFIQMGGRTLIPNIPICYIFAINFIVDETNPYALSSKKHFERNIKDFEKQTNGYKWKDNIALNIALKNEQQYNKFRTRVVLICAMLDNHNLVFGNSRRL